MRVSHLIPIQEEDLKFTQIYPFFIFFLEFIESKLCLFWTTDKVNSLFVGSVK